MPSSAGTDPLSILPAVVLSRSGSAKSTAAYQQKVFASDHRNVSNSVSNDDNSTDLEIRRCNQRININFGLDSGDKLWKVISNLGVISTDPRREFQNSFEDLEILEKRNIVGAKANYTTLK